MTKQQLMRVLGEWREQRRRGPYPREVREAILAYAKERALEGASATVIAGELGIKQETLSLWSRKEQPKGSLVPVRVVKPTVVSRSRHELVIELGPMRVRGLDVATLAELLQRLV